VIQLKELNLSKTGISGDISVFAQLTHLDNLSFSETGNRAASAGLNAQEILLPPRCK